MAKEQRSEDEPTHGGSGVYRAVMALEQLQRDRKSAHDRVSGFREVLLGRREADGGRDAGWLALQEVDIAHEELRVAEEELHAQANEIIASRAALEAERRRYTELFELAPEAYVVTDEHGCVIEANRRAGVVLNLDPVFLAGKPLASFVVSEDRARFRDMIALMSAARIEAEFRITPRKSEQHWVAVAAQGTTCGARQAPVIRWVVRDIRDQKADAAQRDAIESELSGRIRELEASQLLLVQLAASEQLARKPPEEAPSRHEHVLGQVAHELRTPLGSIAGWLHVISQERGQSETLRRAFTSMTRGVRTLAKLVEDLVEHTRLSKTEPKLGRKSFSLLRLVVEVVEDMRPLAELKRIQLRFTADPHRIEMQADSHRLQQVFRNLISNAIKFTPVGGSVRIAVAVMGQKAVVTVSDTGMGIAPDSLRSIFEAFVRLDKSEGEQPGLGLGLSNALRVVQLHGGSIAAESAGIGTGATFRVTLPLTTFN
jgi:PAS domain S-box-containing protein